SGPRGRYRRPCPAFRGSDRHLRHRRCRPDARRSCNSGRKGRVKVKPGKELLFCALGGSGEIGMNVNLYGCDGKWLMVDLGMTFGASEYPGTELVFADLEFIEDRRDHLLGIVLTHAHEDHIGAVPYFAADLGVPLYATPFTARLVQ